MQRVNVGEKNLLKGFVVHGFSTANPLPAALTAYIVTL